MAGIKKSKPTHVFQRDRTILKWVKKANMWCRTTFLNNKQTQEWITNLL